VADVVSELTAQQLRRVCDPTVFEFHSTEELPDLEEVIGQERAVGAVSFGIDIESPGYHMYALGPVGTGKTTTIRKFLARKAADQPVPDDWCYVNNFADPDKPKALRLPAGMAVRFRDEMERVAQELRVAVSRALESREYQAEREQIERWFEERRREIFETLRAEAEAKNLALLQTPQGVVVAPVVEGNVLSPEEFARLDEETRHVIEDHQDEIRESMHEATRRVQQLQREAREQLRELDRQVVSFAVGHLIDALRQEYEEFGAVVDFLDSFQEDVLSNIETFKQLGQLEEMPQQMQFMSFDGVRERILNRYRVNVIVDNSQTKGAPVVFESNLNYHNLVGRIEHQAQFGTLVTDFTLIKGGALHRANGGYLMVEARDLLAKPFAWDALKRALKSGQVRVDAMGEEWRVITTRTLEPESIPLDVKVVLVGDALLYYLLHGLDEDFRELFKVKADFAGQTDWDGETEMKYAQFVGTICREEGLRHFDPSGVAKIVEHGARMVADQRKLGTRFGDIVDLVRESSYWAGKNGHELVSGDDVQRAVKEKVYRSNRVEEQLREMMADGTIMITTEGEEVGQVNGLSVLSLGDYAFGRPSRITARTSVGRAGVIAIDREAGLGGPIHSKGVMILSGYLSGKFAQDNRLALSASITFEQLYEGVEGDSASSAELYALLSSLSGYPIKQSLAVTGSVNQLGQIQAIGGVNEKIEGFYDVCKAKGLTGDQGVIIPQSNVKNLMLREEVVEAVSKGQFHIYSVSTIEEGISLLTGVEAGEPDAHGEYPEGTVYGAVQRRLRELSEKVKAFARTEEEQQKEESKKASSGPSDEGSEE